MVNGTNGATWEEETLALLKRAQDERKKADCRFIQYCALVSNTSPKPLAVSGVIPLLPVITSLTKRRSRPMTSAKSSWVQFLASSSSLINSPGGKDSAGLLSFITTSFSVAISFIFSACYWDKFAVNRGSTSKRSRSSSAEKPKYDDLDAWKRNTRGRELRAMRFWGIYDTWTEYDILAAMTKYQVQRDTKVIGRDGVGGAYIETAVTPEDCIRQFAASILKDNPQGARIETNELMQQLRAQGIPGNARTIHGLLEAGGFLPDGDTYILPAM